MWERQNYTQDVYSVVVFLKGSNKFMTTTTQKNLDQMIARFKIWNDGDENKYDEKKNFYSNVDWNYMQGYSLWQLPKDPEGKGWDKLLEMCATFDLHEIEMKERKYNKKHFRTSLLMRLVKFCYHGFLKMNLMERIRNGNKNEWRYKL